MLLFTLEHLMSFYFLMSFLFSELSPIGLHRARSERPESGDRKGVQQKKLAAHVGNLFHIHVIDMSQHVIQRRMSSVCELVFCQFAHATVRTLQAEHQAALHLGLRPLKLFSFDTFAADLSNLSADKIHDTIDLFRPRRRIYRDHAAIRITGQEGVDRIDETPLLSNFLE